MLKKIVFLVFCLVVFSFINFAQDSDIKKQKAEDVLVIAKTTVNKKIEKESIKSISLNYKTVSKYSEKGEEQNSTETNDFYLNSDKMRLDTFGEYDTNTTNTSRIVNGSLFERNTEVFVDGQKLNAAFTFSTPKETEIKKLKIEFWLTTFPIFLESFALPNLDFIYVGIAESKDGRASVIQTILDERKYQYFFDEKTNLLLMMTESWKNKENKQFQTKYFFSDYREESEITFAHKISFQSDAESIGTGETIIKSLKINPVFKPNFFDVKEK